jgi:hypothetical protein
MVHVLLSRSVGTMDRIIAIRDVEVVAESEGRLVCRVDGRQVEIPTLLVQPGSQVWTRGDRGTLLVPLWLASELGVASC